MRESERSKGAEGESERSRDFRWGGEERLEESEEE